MADVVGYSKKDESAQVASVEALLTAWSSHAKEATNSIVVPTGDRFIGIVPLDRGQIPLWLLDFIISSIEIASRPASEFQIRFGLHSGACRPIYITRGSLELNPVEKGITV
jgi:hypothetical protein